MVEIPEGFLKAILADRADDTPRLILADWLADNDQADYGEYIRVQCQLAQMDGCDREDEPHGCGPFKLEGKCFPCQRAAPLRQRERELWDVGTDAGGFLEIPGHWGVATWRRGLIAKLRIYARDWLEWADHLTTRLPLEAVVITDFLAFHDTERTVVITDFGAFPARRCRPRGRTVWRDIPYGEAGREDYEAVFSAEWPGIAFSLISREGADHLHQLVEAIRSELAQSAGVPVHLFAGP